MFFYLGSNFFIPSRWNESPHCKDLMTMNLRISYLALLVTCSLVLVGCDNKTVQEVPLPDEINTIPPVEDAFTQEIRPRLAAEVNGHPIYATDVDTHIGEIQTQRFANGIEWTAEDLDLNRRRVLEALIDQVLLAQELKTPYSLQDSQATESAIMKKLEARVMVEDDEVASTFEVVTRQPAHQKELKINTLTASGLVRQIPPQATHTPMGWVALTSLEPALRGELSVRNHSVRAVRDRMQWFWVEDRRTTPNTLYLERQNELHQIVRSQKARMERQKLLRKLHKEARIQRQPAENGLR